MNRAGLSLLSRPQALRTSAQASSQIIAGRRYASHGPSYNPPSGYLFGERPPKDGKRVRESWETIYYVGMFGGMALATVIYVYKPDTSIQSWALKEAKARLEARGENYEYKPKSA
ncbi:hypothetical protein I317_02990 [Kwoniella heveanensis CBS 569]|uniref:NADH dehydrogenase [ubiquinone] 1 beta subcomplex subunit 11, mitochondrial n=1 Tax=Kwoniella heveanensis BCC8398 TaxID=1296120 RepID=A0A1B9H0C2_9TREE|nr:hypothetical protein I316_01305 [Kwoniella heveanensis BCC8398]OCF43146.1 hypothetical protein I317_02990 [Kwoniella heveanensis CBS 569]